MRVLVDPTYERPRSEEVGENPQYDPLRELLGLVEPRNLPGSAKSSTRTSVRAPAQERSGEPPRGSALLGERALSSRGRYGSELRRRPETSHSYSDPPVRETFARSPRQEGATTTQARMSAPASASTARANLQPAQQTYRKITAENCPSSNVSHPAEKNSFFGLPRMPRRVDLAIAGLAGSVFIGSLGAAGYFALSASSTNPQAPLIADNAPQTPVTDQSDYGEDLNQQPANASWADQPTKVRTVSIRSDSEVANTSAGESSKDAQSAPGTSVIPGARVDARERSQVATASAPTAPISEFQSEPNIPASGPDTTVDGQKSVRTSGVRPQVEVRNGVVACQASAGRGGHWAWRIIDGRKCWYGGKAGMSKNSLQWVRTAD
jgi:hypothetical protein